MKLLLFDEGPFVVISAGKYLTRINTFQGKICCNRFVTVARLGKEDAFEMLPNAKGWEDF